MKTIIKTTSLLLCLLLLLSSVVSCASTDTQVTDDSTVETTVGDTTEAPDTSLAELTIEDLTADFVDGEYTLDDSPVSPHELLTALYRIAGKPEASRDFEVVWYVGEKDSYYHDATVWSAFQAGIIPFVVEVIVDGGAIFGNFKLGFRIGESTADKAIKALEEEGFKIHSRNGIEVHSVFNTDITRADIVLSMYYYVTTYLGKDIVTEDVLETIADYELFTEKHSERYKMYINDNSNGYPELRKDLPASWNWALDAGIVEAYPDNTLRPDATITRAEFAAMLTRFMYYVK